MPETTDILRTRLAALRDDRTRLREQIAELDRQRAELASTLERVDGAIAAIVEVLATPPARD
ncbi:hypothetical protein [Derxia gummosa]|uniref:Uncharacterized protein n=1 Tax=Derxia gummosa DSM 723 TaxID=1121388 RepID=A0A8B6X433_9BURK|nr:hypothetical protein [Derxia gummosa]